MEENVEPAGFVFGFDFSGCHNGSAKVKEKMSNMNVPDEIVIMRLRTLLRKLEANYFQKS